MSGRSRFKARVQVAMLVVACCLAVSAMPRGFGFDLRIDRAAGGRAVLSIGLASVRVAFAFEQCCPKTDTCRAIAA